MLFSDDRCLISKITKDSLALLMKFHYVLNSMHKTILQNKCYYLHFTARDLESCPKQLPQGLIVCIGGAGTQTQVTGPSLQCI